MDRNAIYRLDPAAAETLTEQLAENLRRAIANGIYKPGDKLPGIRQMAQLCGTSVQVPVDAMKALTDEGFVKARPRVGCVVLRQNRKVWRGRILIVHVGAHSNYCQNVHCSETAILLEAANWRVTHVFVPRDRRDAYDLAALNKSIAEDYDLVLLPSGDPPVVKIVRERGLPYMLLWSQVGDKMDGCIGSLAVSDKRAMSDFAEHCREAGIRHLLRIACDIGLPESLDCLRSAGVAVEGIVVSPEVACQTCENFAKCAYDALLARLRSSRMIRPDLIYFADDHLARGGFWAIERCGLRVPEDVKVVSLVNYGQAPFYPVPLTRFEHNPYDNTKRMVRMISRYLKTGKLPGMILCDMRYVRGETF